MNRKMFMTDSSKKNLFLFQNNFASLRFNDQLKTEYELKAIK
jgi:hypothetical protein